MKKTIFCNPSVIKQLRDAGAKVEKLYMTSGAVIRDVETYRADKPRNKHDLLWGSVAVTDKYEFVHKFSSGFVAPTSHLESDPLSFGGQW